MRRTEPALAAEMADALEGAFGEVGLSAVRRPAPPSEGGRPDFVLDVGGQVLVVEVKTVVSEVDASSVVDQLRRYGGAGLVAAERIAEGAKDQFVRAGVGFYDRRGRLRLVVPGVVFVDAMTQPAGLRPTVGVPLGGEVAKEVAIVLMSDPQRRPGLRQLARDIGRSPSSVFEALQRLQTAGLITSGHEPLVPDLFWELEAQWHRQVYPLAATPEPFGASVTDLFQLGLGRGDADGWLLDPEGWALTDTVAAVTWGMPLVASPSYPPDFYVPSAAVLHRAVATLGRASNMEERACTVSMAPARLVCRRRVNRPGSVWPLADHVVVALDLAKDRARGREALEQWRPEGFVRVW